MTDKFHLCIYRMQSEGCQSVLAPDDNGYLRNDTAQRYCILLSQSSSPAHYDADTH